MVKPAKASLMRLFAGCAALLLGLAVQAAGPAVARLDASLDRYGSAMGEPLNLSLRARGVNLEALDDASLNVDFDVSSRSVSRSGNEETLSLVLYPKRIGHLRILPFHVDRFTTPVLNLNVTASSAQTPQVLSRLFIEPVMPQVSEAARLTLEICDDGSLEWQRPVLPAHAGMVLRVLGEAQIDIERDGVRCTAHRYFWAAQATQAGALVLQTPPLSATKFGGRLRYPALTLSYSASALPVWLPAIVPPGKPEAHADPLPLRWPLNRPLVWRFTVTGSYSADSLRRVLQAQIRGQAELRAYPVLIEPVRPEPNESPLNQFIVSLFILPQQSGELTLPSLRLPWFNPTGNQLGSLVLPGASVRIFNPIWHTLAMTLAGLAVLASVFGAGLFAYRSWRWRWRWARRTGLRAIRQAKNPAQLVDALRHFSLSQNDPPASTLGGWLRQASNWNVDLTDTVRRVEKLRYGLQGDAFEMIRTELLGALRCVRPEMRLSWMFGR